MRKSRAYFIVSVLFLLYIALICLVFRIPNSLWSKIIIFALSVLGLIYFRQYQVQRDLETTMDLEKELEELKNTYKSVNTMTTSYANIIYKNLDSDFINDFNLFIDDTDYYLLDFQDNINQINELDSKELISNDFIKIACLMDSLVSAWKIKSKNSSQKILKKEVLLANCELAVSIALHLLDLSYKDLKDNIYIKELIDLLAISYIEEEYGTVYAIECEKTILELLYNIYHQ